MGQQQLLLLVLGVVIVGLAVVVGINAFSENQVRSNADAMVNDALRIASDLQAYALKPEQFGGGGGWGNVNTASKAPTLSELGTSSSNVNGDYTLSATSCTGDVTGTVSGDLFIKGTGANSNGNIVCVGVSGTKADDVTTGIKYGS